MIQEQTVPLYLAIDSFGEKDILQIQLDEIKRRLTNTLESSCKTISLPTNFVWKNC